MKFKLFCAAATLAVAAANAHAQTAQPPASGMTAAAAAKAFGAREYVQNISLSPDGAHVAMVVPDAGRGSMLQVADFTSGKAPQTIMRTSGSPDRLGGCKWASVKRIVCVIFFVDTSSAYTIPFTRLIGVNLDGAELKMVSDRTTIRSEGVTSYGGSIIDWTGNGSGDGSVLMMHLAIPEKSIGTTIASSKEGLGVDLVDTAKLTHRLVESPKRNIDSYMTDGVGHVRLIGLLAPGSGGYMGDTITYSYRRADKKDFEPLGTLKIGTVTQSGLEPQAVDPALDSVYALDDQDGRRVLVRIKLDGSKAREVVVAKPGLDIDGVIQIGRQRRVVGATWAGEKREIEFFDPELRRLAGSLGRALPNAPLIAFADATADEKQLLLHAGGDDNAGAYYLFDKTSKHLEEVMSVRPQLAAVKLAKVTPITFKAADGTAVPGYLTLPPGSTGKNLPTIVMPHGGPAARDEWGFDYLSQFFANRGFAVLQPNFRGSSGYGEAWFAKNGFQSWRIAIGDVNDGARWLAAQGIADPKKLAIVGWSYGGYAALQSSMLDADLFKAIVAIAPVTDLEMLRNEHRFYTDFPLVDREIGSGAHVAEGSPARHAAQIKAPVLLFHGDLDTNVRIDESRVMAGRLRDAGKKVEFVEFKGLDHYLQDSAARAQMLEKSDAFLRASLGM